jgi:hypothetical protein
LKGVSEVNFEDKRKLVKTILNPLLCFLPMSIEGVEKVDSSGWQGLFKRRNEPVHIDHSDYKLGRGGLQLES